MGLKKRDRKQHLFADALDQLLQGSSHLLQERLLLDRLLSGSSGRGLSLSSDLLRGLLGGSLGLLSSSLNGVSGLVSSSLDGLLGLSRGLGNGLSGLGDFRLGGSDDFFDLLVNGGLDKTNFVSMN